MTSLPSLAECTEEEAITETAGEELAHALGSATSGSATDSQSANSCAPLQCVRDEGASVTISLSAPSAAAPGLLPQSSSTNNQLITAEHNGKTINGGGESPPSAAGVIGSSGAGADAAKAAAAAARRAAFIQKGICEPRLARYAATFSTVTQQSSNSSCAKMFVLKDSV